MENEVWKDVINYEGFYQVSNLGRVKSLSRPVKSPIRGQVILKEKILKPALHHYRFLYLCKYGTTKNHPVHRMVAKAFIPNPDNKPQVNHINGIKTDNRAENLEWVTQRENSNHALKAGLIKIRKGDAHPCTVITDAEVANIRAFAAAHPNTSGRSIAKIFSISPGYIQHIINGDVRAPLNSKFLVSKNREYIKHKFKNGACINCGLAEKSQKYTRRTRPSCKKVQIPDYLELRKQLTNGSTEQDKTY